MKKGMKPCKEEGCEEPRHTEPSGRTLARCVEHRRANDRARMVRFFAERPGYNADAKRRGRAKRPGQAAAERRARIAAWAARTPEEVRADRERLRPDGRKKCRGCSAWLPLERFSQDRWKGDGLSDKCRECALTGAHRRALPWWLSIGVDPDVCSYCGDEAKDGEHVWPLSKGGPDSVLQIVPACGPCNSSKHAADVGAWRRRRFAVQRFSSHVEIVRDWLRRKGYLLPDESAERLWRAIAEEHGWRLPESSV